MKEIVVSAEGQVASCNAGVEAAIGDIIAITDDDAVPRPDWLKRIEMHFAIDAQVGAVGGRDWVHLGNDVVGGSERVVGRVQWFGGVVGNHHLGVGPPRFVDALKGANMSFRTSAVRGLRFDQRLLGDGAQVNNDLAFSLAVRRSGWGILYDPRVAVDHYPASRHDADQRGHYSPESLRHAAHNYTLTLLDHLSPGRRVVFLIWAVLVGSRAHYGIAQCMRFMPAEGRTAISKWANVMEGRRAAWRSWQRLKGQLGPRACVNRPLVEPYGRSKWVEQTAIWLHDRGVKRHHRSWLQPGRVLSWVVWLNLALLTHPVGRRRPVRTLYRFWRWQIHRRLSGQPVVAEVGGCRIICPAWSNLAGYWISVGWHEYQELRFVEDFIREGDLAIDVGANLGLYSILMARRGARVTAFEPSPRARGVLLSNLELNRVQHYVRVEAAALSDFSGEAWLTVSFEASNHLLADPSSHDVTPVTVKRLDDYLDVLGLDGMSSLSYIKIDVEGHDLSVLRGAESIIKLARPTISVEVWNGGDEIREWFRERDYSIFLYDPARYDLWSVPATYRKQANFLAIPRTKIDWVRARLEFSSNPMQS
jgi:FkbM family methyltransferase